MIRELTDFIPDSIDSSAATSRETTAEDISQETQTKPESVVCAYRPKVVSLFYHQHEGEICNAPYSIKPKQMVGSTLYRWLVVHYIDGW